MTFQLTITPKDVEKLARDLGSTAADFDRAVAAGVLEIAEMADQQAEAEVGKIYRRRIPQRKVSAKRQAKLGRGRMPLWQRTRNLERGRKLVVASGTQAEIRMTGPAAKYARRRHELGVSWTPRNPAGGIIRLNPFFADTVKKIKPQVVGWFESRVRQELGL